MMSLYDHILVLLNKDEEEAGVFFRAIHLAEMNYSRLTIAYIMDDKDYRIAESYDKNIVERAKVESQEFLDEKKAQAEKLEIREVETFLGYGNVRRIVKNDVVEGLKPDLIVCGNNHAQEMESIRLLGSVSDFVANRSRCDVLIVKKCV